MYIRQRDLVVGTVIVLYIVFFALSPPMFVRSILSHPLGVAASFGVAIYTTLYYSKPVGALLIVALLASMTRVTEHLVISDRMRSDGRRALGRDPTDKEILENELSIRNQRIAQLQNTGTPATDQTLQGLIAGRTELEAQIASLGSSTAGTTLPPVAPNTTIPITTPTAPAPTSPAVASPPSTAPPTVPTTAPKPVMACNIENFASF